MANQIIRKAKDEILASGQGKRLQIFFVSKGFKSRLSFANYIGVSSSSINEVVWGVKYISSTLITQIKAKFADLDDEWLLKGETKNLSTNEKPPETDNQQVNDKKEDYEKSDISIIESHILKKYEVIIEQQRHLIDSLLRQIDNLEGKK